MDTNSAVLTASNIKYLLVIHELAHEANGTRSTDVANLLRVKRPSVHQMIGMLKEMRMIRKDTYGAVYLTETGKTLAERYAACFQVVRGYFDPLLPHETDVRAVVCAMLAALPLEDAERMCRAMSRCGRCMQAPYDPNQVRAEASHTRPRGEAGSPL